VCDGVVSTSRLDVGGNSAAPRFPLISCLSHSVRRDSGLRGVPPVVPPSAVNSPAELATIKSSKSEAEIWLAWSFFGVGFGLLA
jgi:hypothetical protein